PVRPHALETYFTDCLVVNSTLGSLSVLSSSTLCGGRSLRQREKGEGRRKTEVEAVERSVQAVAGRPVRAQGPSGEQTVSIS
ncbi:hypothetical protein KUCAC02_023077, partial [Chaenocephalus aceratus]